MLYSGTTVGTVAALIEQTPPNYSIFIDDFYVGNPIGAIDTLTLFAVPYTYDSTKPPAQSTVVSTVSSITIGQFPVINSFVAVNREDAIRFPTSSYVYAQAESSLVALTYGKRFVFYRE